MNNDRPHMDVSECWKLLKSGRNEGIIALYDILWEELYQYAAKTIKDADTAMDIVQELFISLWEKRSELPDVPQVKPYLYVALKNRILNNLAASETREHHIKAWHAIHRTEGEAGFTTLVEKELYQSAMAEVDQLPQRMKEVYTLVVLEAVPVSEIARNMGISEQTVRNQANLAARRVRQSIMKSLLFSVFF